jgi:hypothetical protein
MLMLLANLSVQPESVPINPWNEVKGVPVNDTAERPDPIALVRIDRDGANHDAEKRGAAIRRTPIYDGRITGAVSRGPNRGQGRGSSRDLTLIRFEVGIVLKRTLGLANQAGTPETVVFIAFVTGWVLAIPA